MVVAGVAGAIVLGVTLGVWARPTDSNPAARVIARTRDAVPPRAALQIVVSEAPAAPIGSPLEVLPANLPPPQLRAFAAPMAEPDPAPVEPIAPRRPRSGLMKVAAQEDAPPPALVPTPRVEPKPEAEPTRKARPDVAKSKPPVAKAKALSAKPKPDARLAKQKRAEAKAAEARAAEAKAKKATVLAEARAGKLEKARAQKLTKAELAKVERAKIEKTKAQKAKATKLANAEARPTRKVEKVAIRTEPKARRPAAKAVRTAKAETRKAVAAKPVKVAAAKAAPKPVKPKRTVPRDDGSLRVARATPCYSDDPGETAVCADQRLGQRDRQLQDAYRNAEAAGVPASALRRQQSRWLAARAAAAREAPWAVEDVYVARISELRDQTRDAREN